MALKDAVAGRCKLTVPTTSTGSNDNVGADRERINSI